MPKALSKLTHIDALTDFLNANGFKASAWKSRRVYINGLVSGTFGKDMTVYIEMDDPTEPPPEVADTDYMHPLYSGCSLKVFSKAENVSQSWLVNRNKQVKLSVMNYMYECGLSKVEPPEDWRKVIL